MVIEFILNNTTQVFLSNNHPAMSHGVTQRELAVQRRAAAEERLDQLVDMYGDPAVNDELRTRLPLASRPKEDIRSVWQRELDELAMGMEIVESDCEGDAREGDAPLSTNNPPRRYTRSNTYDISDSEDDHIAVGIDRPSVQSSPNAYSNKRRSHSPPQSDMARSDDKTNARQKHKGPSYPTNGPTMASSSAQHHTFSTPGYHTDLTDTRPQQHIITDLPSRLPSSPVAFGMPPYWYPNHPLLYPPPAFPHPQYMHHPLTMQSPVLAGPTAPSSNPTGVTAPQSVAEPHQMKFQNQQQEVHQVERSVQQLHHPYSSHKTPHPSSDERQIQTKGETTGNGQSFFIREISDQGLQAQHPTVATKEGGVPAVSGIARRADGGQAAGRTSVSVGTQTADDAHGRGTTDKVREREKEQHRQITQLLAELDKTRLANKQLKQELSDRSLQLEKAKLEEKTQEAATEARIAEKTAELMEQVHAAQKQRDDAMLNRLRIANDQRDEAMQKLKAERTDRLATAKKQSSSSDQNIERLVQNLSDGDPTQLHSHGMQLFAAVRAAKEQAKDSTSEQLHIVTDERDEAIKQCEELKSKLLDQERRLRAQVPDKEQTALLQAKLLATQQERDLALTRIRKQDDEIENLRVYCSLHKSLTDEKYMRDQFNNTLAHVEGQLQTRDKTLDVAQKQNNQLLAQLKVANTHCKEMQQQQIKAQHCQREAEQNADKLERLVKVLRRKIAQLGVQEPKLQG